MNRKVVILLASLALLSSEAGCRRLRRTPFSRGSNPGATAAAADGPAAPTSPPTPQWKDNEVSFQEIATKGSFYIRDMKLDVHFSDLPAGAEIVSGDQRASGSYGVASMSIDLTPKLAALSPRNAFDYKYKFDPNVDVTVKFSPAVSLTLHVPAMSTSYSLSEAFKKAADAPLPFAGDPAAGAHSVAFPTSLQTEVLGPAKTLADIDWVAVESDLPTRTGKTCSGYKKNGETKESSYPLTLVDRKLTVVEAKTSKVVASKDFKAKNDCPYIAFNGAANSYPSSDEEKAWLRTLRSGKN